jgi:hypothetical protein
VVSNDADSQRTNLLTLDVRSGAVLAQREVIGAISPGFPGEMVYDPRGEWLAASLCGFASVLLLDARSLRVRRSPSRPS